MKPRHGTERVFEKCGDMFIWAGIAAYTIFFCYLTYLKYNCFGYYDWDFASDATILWNSVHGKLLYYPFLEQNIFGAHLYLIIFLVLPVYAIFQHPLALLFLQSLFLGLAAFPLYKLAKLKLSKIFALAVSAAYLLYASVGFINLFETHFEIYEIFFLFYALFYFEKADFKKFMIFILLAISCKENVSFVVFMFGIYGLLRRRSSRWIVVPSLLGIIWFLAAVKGVIPHFAKDAQFYQDGFIFSVYYKHLGNSLPEMIKTIVLRPDYAASYIFTPGKLQYLSRLFVSTGFLSFFSPGPLLMTLPILAQNLLSSAPTHAQIYYQYVAVLLPFIFSSVVSGLSRVLRQKELKRHRMTLAIVFLAVVFASGFYLKAPQLHFRSHVRAYCVGDEAKAKDRLLALIPPKASVIASFQFLPKLANRRDLYSIHLVATGYRMYTAVKYEPPQNLAYALVDFNEPLLVGSFFPPQAAANMRSFLKERHWKALKAFDDVVLFKKDESRGNDLVEEVMHPQIENKLDVGVGDGLVLVGYDEVKDSAAQDRLLHIVYYWKRVGDVQPELAVIVQFLDVNGEVAFDKGHVFGYRIYPPKDWPENQIMRENYYMLIPSKIKAGNYRMTLGVYDLNDEKKRDALGMVVLGEISIQ